MARMLWNNVEEKRRLIKEISIACDNIRVMSNKALYCTHVCVRLSSFRQSMSVCNVMYKSIGRKIFTD